MVAFRKHVLAHAKLMAAEVTSETNINVFLTDFLTAFKANAVSLDCFRLEYAQADNPPGWPNQGGGWRSYKLFIDPEQTVSAINQHLRKEGRVLSLTVKDLQAQLSKTEYWVEDAPTKRIGPKGSRVVTRCWGFQLDNLPQGRVDCTDEAFTAYKTLRISDTAGDDADPRRGPFYAIVAAIEAADRESIREEKANGG